MAYSYLPVEQTRAYCEEIFRRHGFTDEECRQIVDVVLTADLFGIESHGIQRIKPVKGDIIIRNTNTSAFSYTTLDQILRAKGITELYLAGVATNFVVDSTARYGSELGYNIHVVEDLCASWTQEMHEFGIKYILPQFGEVTDSATMIARLQEG